MSSQQAFMTSCSRIDNRLGEITTMLRHVREIKDCPKFINLKGYSESARNRRHLQAMDLWA